MNFAGKNSTEKFGPGLFNAIESLLELGRVERFRIDSGAALPERVIGSHVRKNFCDHDVSVIRAGRPLGHYFVIFQDALCDGQLQLAFPDCGIFFKYSSVFPAGARNVIICHTGPSSLVSTAT